jgi:hypothetical protein
MELIVAMLDTQLGTEIVRRRYYMHTYVLSTIEFFTQGHHEL